MLKVKYELYHLFLKCLKENKRIVITGNSANAIAVIDLLKEYNMYNVYYLPMEGETVDIYLKYNACDNQLAKQKTSYSLSYPANMLKEDLAYTIISAFESARRRLKHETHYCYNLCV